MLNLKTKMFLRKTNIVFSSILIPLSHKFESNKEPIVLAKKRISTIPTSLFLNAKPILI